MTHKEKKRLVRLRKAKRTAIYFLLLLTFPISVPLIFAWAIANSPDSSTQYSAMHWDDNNLMY